ncbi:RNA polymerase sigma factor [bacterium]|nr:RNA polymerase sigma factor [bacterium]
MAEQSGQNVEFWREAYDEHGAALFAFLRHRVKNRQDAEDLLQDVFIRVIKTDTELREPSRVKSYLFSTAYNLTINYFRRRKFDDLSSNGDDPNVDPFEQVPDVHRLQPDHEAEWMDLNEHVLTSMEALNERYKTAFQFGVLEGRAYNEIARMTGWTDAQVKVNVHRARKAIIKDLRDRGVLEENQW